VSIDPGPWPPGDEPGNAGGLDMGTVKPPGDECAREWPDVPPGLDYYSPPPVDDGSAREAARETRGRRGRKQEPEQEPEPEPEPEEP
jgi:hypothetical protein